jgi:hypothetical protein
MTLLFLQHWLLLASIDRRWTMMVTVTAARQEDRDTDRLTRDNDQVLGLPLGWAYGRLRDSLKHALTMTLLNSILTRTTSYSLGNMKGISLR